MIHNIMLQHRVRSAAIDIKPVKSPENELAPTIPNPEIQQNELKKLEHIIHKQQQTLQIRQQVIEKKLQDLEDKKTDALQKKLDAESAQQSFKRARDDAIKIINSFLLKTGCQVIPEPGSAAWHQVVVAEKRKLYCFYTSDNNKKNCYDKLKLHYDTYYHTWHQQYLKVSQDREVAEKNYHAAAQQIATIKQTMTLEEQQLQQLKDTYQQQRNLSSLLHEGKQPLFAKDRQNEKPVLPEIRITDSDATNKIDSTPKLLGPARPAKSFDVYMHHTDEENLHSIHRLGLYPAGPSGRQKGIGDENGNCCADGVYVVQPGKAIMDPRSAIALVVSTDSPHPDVNYHNGEAGIFYPKNTTNNLPPVREVEERACQATYSLTLPITPETQSGLRRFLEQDTTTSTQDASDIVLEKFKRNFPIWGLDKNLCKTVSSSKSEQDGDTYSEQDSLSDISL